MPAFADEDAPEGKRIVRVGCYEDGDYMSYDEAGQLVGHNIDYLEELRRWLWTGRTSTWTSPAGPEAYDALENGEIDLLPAVYYTEGAHGPHAILGRAHVQHLHHAQRAP